MVDEISQKQLAFKVDLKALMPTEDTRVEIR